MSFTDAAMSSEPSGLEQELEALQSRYEAVSHQMQACSDNSREWQVCNKDLAQLKKRLNSVRKQRDRESTVIELLNNNQSRVFLRTRELAKTKQGAKAFLTYKKIKKQLLTEFSQDEFEEQKKAIQSYLKYIDDQARSNSRLLRNSSNLSIGEDPESDLSPQSASTSYSDSFLSSAVDVSVVEEEPQPAQPQERDEPTTNGIVPIENFTRVEDFIDYLARISKVPVEMALALICDLGFNDERLFTRPNTNRAVQALLAHRQEEQVKILLICDVAHDERYAKEALQSIVATHEEGVWGKIQQTFGESRQTYSRTSSYRSFRSGSTSSISRDSAGGSTSATSSFRHARKSDGASTISASQASLRNPAMKQFRHSSPAINAFSIGNRGVMNHSTPEAAMRQARKRASRKQSASTGRINLPQNLVVREIKEDHTLASIGE